MKCKILTVCTLSAISLLISCSKFNSKCDASLSYDNGIKAIIDANCTSSGCHGAGSVNGDFTSYTEFKKVIDAGKFREQVIDKKSMPKAKKLSKSDLNKLTCWLDNGFPQ